MEPELTLDELEILNEAMVAWVDKDLAGEFISSVTLAILTPTDNPEKQAQYKREERLKRTQSEETRRNREERAVLIRAKLIALMDRQRAERISKEIFRD